MHLWKERSPTDPWSQADDVCIMLNKFSCVQKLPRRKQRDSSYTQTLFYYPSTVFQKIFCSGPICVLFTKGWGGICNESVTRSSTLLDGKVSLLQDISPFPFKIIKENTVWSQEKTLILITVKDWFKQTALYHAAFL